MYDLHCHSTCSDGTLTPVQLISLAKERGLSGLSITDHDTVEAYKTAIPAAKKEGIRLGSGVEFSCDFYGSSIHILGYDFLLDHPAIQELILRHRQRRSDRNMAMLVKLKKCGISIDPQELAGSGRPHIAAAMVKRGYVGSIKEAFSQYLGEGKKCYVSGASFPISESIEILHQAQGKAFIAHPHLISHIEPILKLPFDGIECYYSLFTKKEADKWLKIAQEKKWLVSGGSDFHGALKPNIPLGCSFVDQSTFQTIFQHELFTSH